MENASPTGQRDGPNAFGQADNRHHKAAALAADKETKRVFDLHTAILTHPTRRTHAQGVKYTSNEDIYVVGDLSDAYYIVVVGVVTLFDSKEKDDTETVGDPVVKRLGVNEGFGEEELISGGRRAYSAVATQKDTILFRVRADDFRRTLESEHRDLFEAKVEFLSTLAPFRAIAVETVRKLAPAFHEVLFKQRECLVRQGDRADCMYAIKAGNVVVYVDPHHKEGSGLAELDPKKMMQVCMLDAGNIIGDMTVLANIKTRTASVLAASDVVAYRVRRGLFLRRVPHDMLENMRRIATDKLRMTTKQVQRQPVVQSLKDKILQGHNLRELLSQGDKRKAEATKFPEEYQHLIYLLRKQKRADVTDVKAGHKEAAPAITRARLISSLSLSGGPQQAEAEVEQARRKNAVGSAPLEEQICGHQRGRRPDPEALDAPNAVWHCAACPASAAITVGLARGPLGTSFGRTSTTTPVALTRPCLSQNAPLSLTHGLGEMEAHVQPAGSGREPTPYIHGFRAVQPPHITTANGRRASAYTCEPIPWWTATFAASSSQRPKSVPPNSFNHCLSVPQHEGICTPVPGLAPGTAGAQPLSPSSRPPPQLLHAGYGSHAHPPPPGMHTGLHSAGGHLPPSQNGAPGTSWGSAGRTPSSRTTGAASASLLMTVRSMTPSGLAQRSSTAPDGSGGGSGSSLSPRRSEVAQQADSAVPPRRNAFVPPPLALELAGVESAGSAVPQCIGWSEQPDSSASPQPGLLGGGTGSLGGSGGGAGGSGASPQGTAASPLGRSISAGGHVLSRDLGATALRDTALPTVSRQLDEAVQPGSSPTRSFVGIISWSSGNLSGITPDAPPKPRISGGGNGWNMPSPRDRKQMEEVLNNLAQPLMQDKNGRMRKSVAHYRPTIPKAIL